MKEEQFDRIKSLLTKNLLSQLDEHEEAELKSWREASSENEDLYNKLKDKDYIRSRYKDYKKIVTPKESPKRLRTGFPFIKSTAFWRVAALWVLGLVTAFSIIQIVKEVKDQRTLKTIDYSNGVTLLIDGSKAISLNSVSNNSVIGDVCVKVDNNTLKYFPKKGSSKSIHQIIVPEVLLFKVILPDESVVWLNSKSTLTLPSDFKSDTRQVKLDGEGFFDVSKDAKRPFSVCVDGMTINVLGTQFNVKAYKEDSDVATTLVEGKIKVGYKGTNGKDEKFYLNRGEQSLFDKSSADVKIEDVNTDIYTSWREGFYFFDKQRLEDIMKNLGRWYGLEVLFLDESAKDIEMSGKLNRGESPEELLNTFALMMPGRIKVKGKTVTIH